MFAGARAQTVIEIVTAGYDAAKLDLTSHASPAGVQHHTHISFNMIFHNIFILQGFLIFLVTIVRNREVVFAELKEKYQSLVARAQGTDLSQPSDFTFTSTSV